MEETKEKGSSPLFLSLSPFCFLKFILQALSTGREINAAQFAPKLSPFTAAQSNIYEYLEEDHKRVKQHIRTENDFWIAANQTDVSRLKISK